VESFSKGMKMRLNLCRALLHDPEMLFLDEPTTGQDPERARTTRELIVDLKRQGRTVFLTTHNMAEAAEICDEVGFLVNGTIPVSGAPEALMRAQGRRTLEVSVETGRGIDKLSFPMDGIGHNRAFAELLETDTVVAIHSLEASLDDIFIKAVKGEIEQEAAR
jgi:fluoroquinolone transport system ATP-binding protein